MTFFLYIYNKGLFCSILLHVCFQRQWKKHVTKRQWRSETLFAHSLVRQSVCISNVCVRIKFVKLDITEFSIIYLANCHGNYCDINGNKIGRSMLARRGGSTKCRNLYSSKCVKSFIMHDTFDFQTGVWRNWDLFSKIKRYTGWKLDIKWYIRNPLIFHN